ncbi:MAG: glutaredoxin domain-containing protein [Bacteroides sp.]|nr:glutaredoxin domain-containing protein [Bacteroides sp.]
MKTVPVESYSALNSLVSQTERSFLLLYKGGAEQSDCALKRIKDLNPEKDIAVFTADVATVRDIHGKLGVDTAPSLVIFKQNKVTNIIKGCLTEASYDSLLSGREMGGTAKGEGKTKQVTVYSTPSCSWCTTLKTYLDSHQVSYREINVAADTVAAEAMVKKSGQQGVPQTDINGQMIVGFDKTRINQLLEIK